MYHKNEVLNTFFSSPPQPGRALTVLFLVTWWEHEAAMFCYCCPDYFTHTVVASARGEASSVCGVGGLHTLPVVEDGACMPWASTPVMCKRSPRSSLRKKKVRCLSPTCTVAYISLPSLMLRLLRGYWRHCRLRHDGNGGGWGSGYGKFWKQ